LALGGPSVYPDGHHRLVTGSSVTAPNKEKSAKILWHPRVFRWEEPIHDQIPGTLLT
jgi:hypothetical protein